MFAVFNLQAKTCNWLFNTYMSLVADYFHICFQSVQHIIRKSFVIPFTCFGLGQAVMLSISNGDFKKILLYHLYAFISPISFVPCCQTHHCFEGNTLIILYSEHLGQVKISGTQLQQALVCMKTHIKELKPINILNFQITSFEIFLKIRCKYVTF